MRAREETEIGQGFIIGGVLWLPFYREILNLGRKDVELRGPLCPECLTQMDFESSETKTKLKCINPQCNKKVELPQELDQFRQVAHRVTEGKLREGIQIISLDLPPGLVKAESENENYWIEARISQNKGKLMGLVYFGRKIDGKQNKKDYAQVFLDFSDEQMRFDKGNMHPIQELTGIQAKFEHSSTNVTRNQ